MSFSDSLLLCPKTETSFSGLNLHIHPTILTSFPSGLITLLSFTIKSHYSRALRSQAEYNLAFASRGKHLLVNESNKSVNLLSPFLILAVTHGELPPLLRLCS